jgi:type II secretory pathway pseudopilin PulG
MNPSIHSARSDCAFTLTDLLALIAILALVALVTVPALAGVQNKGGRLECANNLRQIGMESMVYAQENKGWLPIMTLGAANGNGASRNKMNGLHYVRYVYLGRFNTQIPTNGIPGDSPTQGLGFQNLGYLYQDGQAGNGSIFFCPAMWGQGGASSYNPLLTTDSNGAILSSYFYNPRVTSFTGTPPRRYQTVNQLEPHKLLAVDSLPPNSTAHIRDHGWNVLFTDGSVQFSRITQNNNSLFKSMIAILSDSNYTGYDQSFNALEQDN